jgi:hypothetical protein
MKSPTRIVVLALVSVAPFVTTSARAQKGADSLTRVKSEGVIAAPAAAPTATPTATPADTTVHKKGGMFGKLKGVAHNKTVQSIAKTAVCSAVPGGQYMMGAAEAAKNKTSIASGAANAQSCIPGMPGAGTGLGGVGGLGGGKAALAGAAMGAAGSLGTGAVPGGAGGAPTAAQIAALSAMTRGMPAGGAAGMTPAQMAQMQAAMGGTGASELTTEASGEQMKLSGAVADEIKKGKLVIKHIDWVRGAAAVSAPSTEGFMNLMQSAGQAMTAAGGTYRVDVYMDKKYSDQEIASLGLQRTIALVSLLQANGVGEGVSAGKVGKDKEQRVEIVKVK